MTDGKPIKVLMWYWRYRNLCVEEFQDLEGAFRQACADSDNGEAFLECIEELTESGSVHYSLDDAEAWDREQSKDEPPPEPVLARRMKVLSPKGEPAVEWLSGDELVDDSGLKRWRDALGDRVVGWINE